MPRPTRSSRRIAHLAVVLAPSPALACGSESVVPTGTGPGPEPSTGTIEATSATTGEDPDPDGYTLTLDGAEGREVAPDGTVTFDDVEEGDHGLALSGAARNCRVDGANPRTVTVSAGATATTTFAISCPRVDRIAFVGDRNGNADIRVMDADGANPTRLTDDPGEDLAPRWAP